MPSTAHRIIVGALRLAKTRGVIRGLIDSRCTHATAPGTRASATRACRCVAGMADGFRAELLSAEEACSEDALALLGHVVDHFGRYGHWKREPRAVIPVTADHHRDQRNKLLAVPCRLGCR